MEVTCLGQQGIVGRLRGDLMVSLMFNLWRDYGYPHSVKGKVLQLQVFPTPNVHWSPYDAWVDFEDGSTHEWAVTLKDLKIENYIGIGQI